MTPTPDFERGPTKREQRLEREMEALKEKLSEMELTSDDLISREEFSGALRALDGRLSALARAAGNNRWGVMEDSVRYLTRRVGKLADTESATNERIRLLESGLREAVQSLHKRMSDVERGDADTHQPPEEKGSDLDNLTRSVPVLRHLSRIVAGMIAGCSGSSREKALWEDVATTLRLLDRLYWPAEDLNGYGALEED